MRSKLFRRSVSLISAWCVAIAVLGASLAQTTLVQTASAHAAEFKPFVTLQVAGPGTLISIAERVATVAEVPALTEQIAMAVPFRNTPGVNAAGTIGLAIAASDESLFGVDAIVSLPVNNFALTGMELMIRAAGVDVRRDGTRFTFATPVGDIIAYQRQGFFIVATEGAAEFAATANPAELFAEVADFTLGAHFNLEHVTEETVEAIVNSLSMLLAMQDMGFLGVEVLDEVTENLESMATVTMGMIIDPRTLNISGTIRTIANDGTELAGRYARLQEALANSKMGAFLPDTPQTVFSWHSLHYFTDTEIETAREILDGIAYGLIEGLYDAMEEYANEEQLVRLIEAIEAFFEYADGFYDWVTQDRVIDTTTWLDSEGTWISAMATSRTAEVQAFDAQFYGRLVEIFGLETFIADKIQWNYATVAGYSLSAIPNIFADLPADTDLPAAVKEVLANIPLSLFWAVKEGEALVYAIGPDFDKTEATVKAILARTQTPTAPAQTAVFAAKPFAEFFLNAIVPLLSALDAGLDEEEYEQVVSTLAPFLASADAEIIYTETYPDASSYLQTFQVNSEFVTALIKAVAEMMRTFERSAEQWLPAPVSE